MTHNKSPDISYKFTSGTAQVRQTLDQTLTDVRDANIDPTLCDVSQIILGEVLNNVVEHAYGFEEGHSIELSIWLRTDGLWCEVLDNGLPMPNGVPPAGVRTDVDPDQRGDLPEGGFGWAMVRELTENIQYFRANDTNQLLFLIPTPAADQRLAAAAAP